MKRTTRSIILHNASRSLWFFTVAMASVLFAMGVRPAVSAILVPGNLQPASYMVAAAQTLAKNFSLEPALLAFYALMIRGSLFLISVCIGYLIVRQQRRQSYNWFSWFVAVFMVSFGMMIAQDVLAFGIAVFAPTAFDVALEAFNSVGWLLFVTFLYLFPDGHLIPRWAAIGLLAWWVLWFIPEEFTAGFILGVVALLIGAVSLIYRYVRVATTHQRQQMKWVVFGLILFLTINFTSLNLIKDTNLFTEFTTLQSIMIPASIAIAMLRYRLFDIDFIIRKTIQYVLLTSLLVLVYFGSVVVLQSLVENLTGEQSPLVIVLSTLAIAALFNPLRVRVQGFIDRRFYRKKFNAELALAQFAATARDEVDVDQLTTALLSLVEETVQPEQVSLWINTK